MNKLGLAVIGFTIFAFGLPLWLMQTNAFDYPSVHGCTGSCYDEWKAETGGVVAMAEAADAARAEASPEQLGESLYIGCVACHGAGGEGGVGPRLAGQGAIAVADMLTAYKNGETRGAQSSLMWGQAAALNASDIDNLSAFIATL